MLRQTSVAFEQQINSDQTCSKQTIAGVSLTNSYDDLFGLI